MLPAERHYPWAACYDFISRIATVIMTFLDLPNATLRRFVSGHYRVQYLLPNHPVFPFTDNTPVCSAVLADRPTRLIVLFFLFATCLDEFSYIRFLVSFERNRIAGCLLCERLQLKCCVIMSFCVLYTYSFMIRCPLQFFNGE